jgi:hypothetical protein
MTYSCIKELRRNYLKYQVSVVLPIRNFPHLRIHVAIQEWGDVGVWEILQEMDFPNEANSLFPVIVESFAGGETDLLNRDFLIIQVFTLGLHAAFRHVAVRALAEETQLGAVVWRVFFF